MEQYTVKQVAELYGVSAHTIRFYDNAGLFPDVERGENGEIVKIYDERFSRENAAAGWTSTRSMSHPVHRADIPAASTSGPSRC